MLTLLAAPTAHAYPLEGPAKLCATYPNAASCVDGSTSCQVCHAEPPTLNPFGAQVRAELDSALRAEGLPQALGSVEELDADEDGWTNLEELLFGTLPGDPLSAHVPSTPTTDALQRKHYPFGEYDAAFALRRLKVAFCGVGPSWEDVEAVRDADDPSSVLHETLDVCLQSEYWRRQAVPRLADPRIRPLVALGTCENLQGDFEYDYRLFAYAMTGGRDVRDLLLANYHVLRDGSGDLVVAEEGGEALAPPVSRAGLTCRDPMGNEPPGNGGQPLAPEHRAGMMTTQWFLVIQTQASYLPRTTAAAAYRAWLGFDISRFEGLFAVEGEPRDIDDIEIDQSPCYQCHATLDPLAYAFAYYNGVGFTGIPGGGGAAGSANGTYNPQRPTTFFLGPQVAKDSWAESPPTAYALGDPMPAETDLDDSTGLVHVARRFANSDAFARNVASMVWTVAVGHAPGPGEHQEFAAVTEALREANYSADALAHAIIDTRSFGAP